MRYTRTASQKLSSCDKIMPECDLHEATCLLRQITKNCDLKISKLKIYAMTFRST